MGYRSLASSLARWAYGSLSRQAQLQDRLDDLILNKLPGQDGGQLVSFTVPGQSAAYQHSLSLDDLISAYSEAIDLCQGTVNTVRRTSARFW